MPCAFAGKEQRAAVKRQHCGVRTQSNTDVQLIEDSDEPTAPAAREIPSQPAATDDFLGPLYRD